MGITRVRRFDQAILGCSVEALVNATHASSIYSVWKCAAHTVRIYIIACTFRCSILLP